MQLKIEFKDLAFRAAMKEAVIQLKADGPQLVREEVRLFIGEYMKRSPPFAGGDYGKRVGSPADYKAGEKTITGDLAQVAGHGERGYLQFVADTFGTTQIKQQLFKKGTKKPYLIDWDKVAFNIGELAKHHRSKINKAGRPPNRQKGAGGKGTGDKSIGRWVAREKIIVPNEIYAQYLKQLYDAIGSAKASFNAAAIALGLKPFPAWVKRHGALGTYTETGDPVNFVALLGGRSQVPGAQRAVDEAIAIRAKKFTAEMKRIMSTFARTGKITTRRKSFNS
jgi:hypothetical protein